MFRDLIYQEVGISLADSKQQLVESRLAKRLRALDLNSYKAYYEFLHSDDPSGEERLRMINCVTTNKTDFFREKHHFDYLRSDVFPLLEQQAKQTGKRRLRIWSAACSTGEEPYTLAMTVLDHFGPVSLSGWDIRILASDVDTDVLAKAEKGVYPSDTVDDVPPSTLKKHFRKLRDQDTEQFEVSEEMKQLITFRRINFVDQEWPIHTNFDIIFCRNVMIYFDAPTQDRLLTRFSQKLTPEGHLCIGHSESILRLDHLYRSLGKTVYQHRSEASPHDRENAATAAQTLSHDSQATERTLRKPQRRSSAKRSRQNHSTTTSDASSPPTSNRKRSVGSREKSSPDVQQTNNSLKVPAEGIIVGEVKASAEPMRISTLVGSCIAVCLFDPKHQIGGMNHFMLPTGSRAGDDSATYGVHAMELLINEIMKLGGERQNLVAKVFGGGNVLQRSVTSDPTLAIGDRNAAFAMQFLETDGIPVSSQSVGGEAGRQIHFLTHTGQAFVRPVSGYDSSELPPRQKHTGRTIDTAGRVEFLA